MRFRAPGVLVSLAGAGCAWVKTVAALMLGTAAADAVARAHTAQPVHTASVQVSDLGGQSCSKSRGEFNPASADGCDANPTAIHTLGPATRAGG